MQRVWSLLMIFVSLALSAEGLFSSAKIVHACTDDRMEQTLQATSSQCSVDQIDTHQADTGCSPDGHPCHIGHCPTLLSYQAVKVRNVPFYKTECFIPKQLYLSPALTGLLRPPASFSA